MTPKKKAFENLVGKGENAGNQHFLPFPTMFSALSESPIHTILKYGDYYDFIDG